MRVLIVDDDMVVAKTLARVLRRECVTVETRALAALDRIARGEEFDLVICDVMMPGHDGREVVTRMRAVSAEPPVFVLMSGYDNLEGLPPSVSVLVKPFCGADLHAAIANLFPQRKAG